MTLKRLEILGVAVCLAVYGWLVWPMAWANIDDMPMIRAFGGDETALVENVTGMLERNSWDPKVYKYGSVFFQGPYLILKVWGLFEPVGAHETALTMRTFSVVGGLLMILAAAWVGRRLMGPGAGVIAAVLTFGLYMMARWGRMIHPDTLGLCGLMLALGLLLASLQERRTGLLLGASVVTGVAAAIKLNSIFLTPFLPLAGLIIGCGGVSERWSRPQYGLLAGLLVGGACLPIGLVIRLLATPERIAKAIKVVALETGRADLTPAWVTHLPEIGLILLGLGGAIIALTLILWRAGVFGRYPLLTQTLALGVACTVCFLIGYGLANTAAFPNPGFVAEWFLTESIRLKHSYEVEPWFFWKVMLRPAFWGVYGVCLSGLGLIWGLVRPREPRERVMVLILAAWTLLILVYLTTSVAAPKPRHVLQILPSLILLAAYGLLRLGQAGSRGRSAWLGIILVGLAVSPLIWVNLGPGLDLRAYELTEKRKSPTIRVGLWLAENHPPEARIWHDPYVYVPARFKNRREEFEPRLEWLGEYDPDLILLNQGHYRRYLKYINNAGKMRPGRMKEAAEFYEALLADGLAGKYKEVRKFGRIAVLVKTDN